VHNIDLLAEALISVRGAQEELCRMGCALTPVRSFSVVSHCGGFFLPPLFRPNDD